MTTLEEYRALCTAVGWEDAINFDAAEDSLPRSLYGVVVEHQGEVVGMGRVVGDGALFYYVQDVAVLPAHQGQGVGSMIMEQLVAHVRRVAPKKAFLGVFAEGGTEGFYEGYGFHNWGDLTGMYQVMRKGDED